MSDELTVETALAELERLFPDYLVKVTAGSYKGKRVWTVTAGFEFKGATLDQAMAEARDYKRSSQKGRPI